MKRAIPFLLFLAIFSGCMTGNTVKELNVEPQLFFCPQDDCGKVLEMVIDSAVSSVYCAFFDLDLENVIDKLEEKSSQIDVKLVLDDRYYIELPFAKKDFSKSKLMHDQFCVIDKNKIITGSMNPTFNGDTKNNNNLLFFHSKYLAKNYLDEFDELWNGEFGKGSSVKYPQIEFNEWKIENYFCPDDDCENKILDVLDSAQHSVKFMIFTFTSDPIGDLLVKKHQEGVQVKGVIERRQNSKYSERLKLLEAGIDVRRDSNPATMHHKVFIVDDSIVITGSYNPTNAANTKNDENIIILHNQMIAMEFLEEFNKIYKSATPE